MKFENINEARFAQNLSRAIQIATVSHENEDDTDWSAFAEFHQFLRDAYPKTFSTLQVEERCFLGSDWISGASGCRSHCSGN